MNLARSRASWHLFIWLDIPGEPALRREKEFGPTAKIVSDSWKPVVLVDSEGRTFVYRTAPLPWLAELSIPFHGACQALLSQALGSAALAAKNAKNDRGPHFPCILGHYQQYASVSPSLSKSVKPGPS
jgi:hypothetical protein